MLFKHKSIFITNYKFNYSHIKSLKPGLDFKSTEYFYKEYVHSKCSIEYMTDSFSSGQYNSE